MTSIRVVAERSGLELALFWTPDTPTGLSLRTAEDRRAGDRSAFASTSQPLVEALAAGHGREWAGRRFATTAIGQRLRYRSHRVHREGRWQTVEVVQADDLTGMQFVSTLSICDGEFGLRSQTRVVNAGAEPITLQAVTSLVFSDFGLRSNSDVDAMTLLRGRSDWAAEGRWSEVGLRAAGLPQLTFDQRSIRTRGCIEAVSVSSWSTAYELPVGVLTDARTGSRWSFQIEHNGPWVWQVGELPDGLYLAMLGPTDEYHEWQLTLSPGDSFTTVPASITVESVDGPPALGALTRFRRASLPITPRAQDLVVFNDYMNTIKGDPSADRLTPLIDAAADAGADVFVIDAGWYADDGDWWDAVGEWEPSPSRFSEGLDAVLDHVRRRGMRPGLWLEPEVVGVNSPMAGKLPDEAFLSRSGVRTVDHGRFHLDLASASAIGFLDDVIDRLVTDHGVAYFKFDYNIRAGAGTDAATASAGHGLLLHNRAYLQWVESVRRRHPALILENCASGGMRSDFATTSRFDLQSTSDQEDFHAYAPIAAAAPMLMLPEQAGNWAYPQPEMSDDDITFTLCTAILGRLYLSGWLPRLSGSQRRLVADAVDAHRTLLGRVAHTTPFWPLGFPGWDDEWVALGLRDSGADDAAGVVNSRLYITVWKRSTRPNDTVLSLPPAPDGYGWGPPVAVFPDLPPLSADLVDDGVLRITDAAGRSGARVVSLMAEPH